MSEGSCHTGHLDLDSEADLSHHQSKVIDTCLEFGLGPAKLWEGQFYQGVLRMVHCSRVVAVKKTSVSGNLKKAVHVTRQRILYTSNLP